MGEGPHPLCPCHQLRKDAASPDLRGFRLELGGPGVVGSEAGERPVRGPCSVPGGHRSHCVACCHERNNRLQHSF